MIFRKNFPLKKLASGICEKLDGQMDLRVPDVGTVKHGLSAQEIFWIANRVVQRSA